MDAGIIINPVAGVGHSGEVARRAALARDALKQCGIEGEVNVTNRPGHGRELAQSLVERGAATIVAWGGDGTVNEVASEVAFRGPILGIVPSGSGNGLARELKLPLRDPARALQMALRGRPRWIDAGELGGHLFFNVAGVGLDAQMAVVFNRLERRGRLRYFTAAFREIRQYESSYYILRASDVAISQSASIVALANTRQYGSNAEIAPGARPDDGLLELVVLPALGPVEALWQARRLFNGTVHQIPGSITQSIREVEIASDAMPWFHVDGEVFVAADRLSAKVHERALQIRCDPSRVSRSS